MSPPAGLPVLLDWTPERYELDEAFRAAFAASAGLGGSSPVGNSSGPKTAFTSGP